MTEAPKKELSPRRRIWEAAQELTLGRTYKKKELDALIDPVEARMQALWYDSGETDFSFYSEADYIYILLRSWETSSAGNADFLLRKGLFHPDIRTVLDYHGGFGLTCHRLALALPDVRFYCHTVVQQHADWCDAISTTLGLTNVTPLVTKVDTLPTERCDLLIAQETLEHVKRPFEELRALLETTKPLQYLDGSSFGVDNPGHFRVYSDNGVDVPRNKARPMLTRVLREHGFDPYWKRREGHKSPYNGRPALYDGPGVQLA